MQITINSIHFNADQKLQDYISKKLEKLSTFYDRPMHAEVFLKLESEGSKVKEKIVEVKMQIKGTTLFASDHSQTFEDAVDMTADHLRRQLKRHVEKIRAK